MAAVLERQKCPVCGKLFIPLKDGAGTKFCGTVCSEKSTRKKNKEYALRNKEILKERYKGRYAKKKEALKRKKNADIIEIQRRARAAGLSYGNYVLQMSFRQEGKKEP